MHPPREPRRDPRREPIYDYTERYTSEFIRGHNVPQKKVEISARTGKPKRRKAVRACTNCQRTHLTCDDNRPCERCVKRGCADTCHDGARKKIRHVSPTAKTESSVSSLDQAAPAPKREPPHPIDVMLYPNRPTNTGQRYVQSIPQQPSTPTYPYQNYNVPPTNASSVTASSEHPSPRGYYESFEISRHTHHYPLHHHIHHHILAIPEGDYSENPQPPSNTELLSTIMMELENPNYLCEGAEPTFPYGPEPWQLVYHDEPCEGHPICPHSGPCDELQNGRLRQRNRRESKPSDDEKNKSIFGWVDPPPNPLMMVHDEHSGHLYYEQNSPKDPNEVYQNVTGWYPYREKLRALVVYLRNRLSERDLEIIADVLQKMKLSFYSITQTLTLSERVFIEQSFHRSVLEEEKQFSLLCVPCLVWRWTGEVAAVSPRFAKLMKNSIEELKFRMLFDFMEDSSIPRYFEKFKFIMHTGALSDFKFECTLTASDGEKIDTHVEVSIRRDLFDSPLTILGKFWVK